VRESAPRSSAQDSPVRLRVIHINDVYQLDRFPSFKALVDYYSFGGDGSDGCCEEDEKKKCPGHVADADTDAFALQPRHPPPLADKTIVCLSGDFLAPSLLSSLDNGYGITDVMGKAGVTHVCLGNHEDDVPSDALAQRIRESSFAWLNSNMRSLDQKLGVETAPYDIVEVSSRDGTHRRSVALLGLLTEDPSIYRDGAFAGAIDDMEPVVAAAEHMVSSLNQNNGPIGMFCPVGNKGNIDLFLPLTHQDRPLDRDFAGKFGGGTFPIVLGGHDHDMSDETVKECRILKMGMDATHAAIVDFVWESSESPTRPSVSVEKVEVGTFPPDACVKACVDDHNRVLEELENAKLFSVFEAKHYYELFDKHIIDENKNEDEFSTANNRFQKTTACTAFASFLRQGTKANCAILNAGGIRGNTAYLDEWFTFADLKSEFPFDDPVVTVSIPGSVLEEAIAFSRRLSLESPPREESGFLHTCDGIQYCDRERKIFSIGGRQFDGDTHYQTTCSVALLNGLDENEPLMSWKERMGFHFQEDVGRPIKFIFVGYFAISFWLILGTFDWEKDADEDGLLTRNKIKDRFQERFGSEMSEIVADEIMTVAGVDRECGRIDLHELLAAQLTAHAMHNNTSSSSLRGSISLRHSTILDRMASDTLNESVDSSIVKRAVSLVRHKLKGDDGMWKFDLRRSISSKHIL